MGYATLTHPTRSAIATSPVALFLSCSGYKPRVSCCAFKLGIVKIVKTSQNFYLFPVPRSLFPSLNNQSKCSTAYVSMLYQFLLSAMSQSHGKPLILQSLLGCQSSQLSLSASLTVAPEGNLVK